MSIEAEAERVDSTDLDRWTDTAEADVGFEADNGMYAAVTFGDEAEPE